MKRGYKIGLFIICIVLLGLIILLVWKRSTLNQSKAEPYIEEIQSEEEVTQVQKADSTTTCDTICVYEDRDKRDNSVSVTEARIPGKYIGMNREQLEKALLEDSRLPSLEEREKGFETQHLELFSQDKVKIVRIYDTTPEEAGFYMMAVDHEIWIYLKDKTTLYFKTDLELSQLPESVQQEVIQGKYMDSELAIYHFLESYSS